MSKPLTRDELAKLSPDEFLARYNEKLCRICITIKPLISFYPNSQAKDGRSNHCYSCHEEYEHRRSTEYDKR